MLQIKRKSFQTIEMSFSENRHICGFSCKIKKESRKELSSTSTNVNFTFISRHNIYNIIMENFGCFLLCQSFRNF